MLFAKFKFFKKLSSKENKKAQAMIEFILMVPFLVTIMIFIYQGYVLVHRVQVAQKYLKLSLVTNLQNRSDSRVDTANTGANGTTANPDPVNNFFYMFNDAAGEQMLFGIDSVTSSLLLSFASAKQQKNMQTILKSFAGKETLGVCMGTNIKAEIDTTVFSAVSCGP